MRGDDDADVVVLGAGPAGENVAQYATEGTDLTAVLVERELLGGECSYFACMPSKALLRPVEVAATAGDLAGVSAPELDVPALLARRDTWVHGYDDSAQVSWAENLGLAVVRGEGRLAGERTVRVETSEGVRTLRARRAVVLATGSEPFVPPLYAAALPWGSRDVTGVLDVPERLLVVGGGVVACEAAMWMSALGSRVTMLVSGERLLARSEPFAGEHVLEALQERGVTVHLGTSGQQCARAAAEATGLGRIHGGEVTVTTPRGDVVADEVLVATGRRPRLGEVGLESVGLTPQDVTSGHLPDWLVAVGDASGGPPLTHWGKYQARVLGERIAAEAGAPRSMPAPPHVPVPQVVFTDPEVASVGLTEAEARESGADVVTSRVAIASAAGVALLRDHPRGEAQLVVDRRTKVLLGATFVGPSVADLLHAATVAIVGQVPVPLLRHAVPSYPAPSELWLRLLEALPVDLRAR